MLNKSITVNGCSSVDRFSLISRNCIIKLPKLYYVECRTANYTRLISVQLTVLHSARTIYILNYFILYIFIRYVCYNGFVHITT